MERRFKTVACFLVLILAPLIVQGQPFGLGISAAQTKIDIAFVWDHDQPENVTYYAVYVSTQQGVFSNPHARVTKLPATGTPIMMTFPADGVTRYMVIRAVNAEGESENSNEITFTPSCAWSDLD